MFFFNTIRRFFFLSEWVVWGLKRKMLDGNAAKFGSSQRNARHSNRDLGKGNHRYLSTERFPAVFISIRKIPSRQYDSLRNKTILAILFAVSHILAKDNVFINIVRLLIFAGNRSFQCVTLIPRMRSYIFFLPHSSF